MIVNSELQTLIHLQEVDLKIMRLQERIKQIPREIEALDEGLQASRYDFAQVGKNIEEKNKERRRLEGDVELLRQKLSKYKTQLMEVKTNREYQAMLHEIDAVEKEIRAKEDLILEGMVAAEEWEKELRQNRGKLEQEEREIAAQRKELENFAAQFDLEIAQLREERSRLQREIPRELIQQYERIASVRRGVALAEARDQSCQSCHVKLRPQLFNDLRTNRFIITCESCNRILYYPEP